MPNARVIGTGMFLPEKILTNFDLEKLCDTTDEWIRKRTGIEHRHVAEPEQGTSDLSVPAAQAAMADAGVDPAEIDCVVHCTVTPDSALPATGNVVQGRLGCVNAAAFDLNAACSGFIYGLTAANSFIRSGLYKTVLVIGAEIQSNRMTWKNRDTSVLFADGAGAVVLRAEDSDDFGILSTYAGSDGASYEMLYVPLGGSRTPISADNVNDDPWTIYMDGRELFRRAVTKFPECAQIAFDATGVTKDDIKLFIGHQANARILEAAAQRMGLREDQLFININHVGNTTAASIPIALHEAREQGRFGPGDYILLASFGAGVTWGSCMLRW